MTVLLLFAASMRTAAASPIYTSALQNDLGMPCAPTCLACHTTAGGGSGTVQQPFGEALMDAGLTGGGDTDGLASALDALGTHDSDGDGNPDVDELASGDNPNGGAPYCVPDGTSGTVDAPAYGCLNTAAAGTGLGGVFLAVAAVALRRRAAG
ncbi:MAG: hypothetical protein RLZZ299_1479 [Pseudomonadota bacterium]|jgi:hypothetical protein